MTRLDFLSISHGRIDCQRIDDVAYIVTVYQTVVNSECAQNVHFNFISVGSLQQAFVWVTTSVGFWIPHQSVWAFHHETAA